LETREELLAFCASVVQAAKLNGSPDLLRPVVEVADHVQQMSRNLAKKNEKIAVSPHTKKTTTQKQNPQHHPTHSTKVVSSVALFEGLR
jgi:hypothetical protein